MKINPYLIARLYTIQEAFAQPGFFSSRIITANKSSTNIPLDWDSLLNKDEDGDSSGGGGGTIKGLRGKNDVTGKAAARRLGRK